MNGVVIEFDGHIGLGVIRDADGKNYPFHCTQIVDGSRTVAIDAVVEFSVIPGGLGRWEAAEIVKR